MTRQFRIQAIVLSLSRIITNTGHRMVYPFLPVFARGLGIDLETIGIAISIRQGIGLLAPIVGAAGDILGRKKAILAGLLLFNVGVGLLGIWPTFPSLLFGLLLASIGRTVTEPSIFAHIAENTDTRWRGAAIAISEFSWSGAYLFGVPILGFIIARTTWLAPFPLIAISGTSLTILLWMILPTDPQDNKQITLRKSLRSAFAQRSSSGILAFGFLSGTSLGLIAIIYGAWMEDRFGLSVSAIGLSVVAIGLAELFGETFAAIRFRKTGRRMLIGLGTLMNMSAAVFLLVRGHNLLSTIVGLFIFFASSEVSTVSRIPFLMELVPEAKSTVIGFGSAAQRGGTAIGVFFGPMLYHMGASVNLTSAAVLDLIALCVLMIRIDDPLEI